LQTRIKNTWYPQARLELVIKQGEFYKADFPTIPEDAEITLSASFYNIFALAVPTPIKKLSWSSFIELVKESTGSDILAKIVSDIVVSALPAKANAKNDFVFQAPNGMFYRVLLVMHSVYGNKRRDLVIYMVETREKVKGGEGKTTILVAGIVLGSKYRSIFLEKNAKYARDHLSALSVDDLAVQLSEMLYDIDSINADAASDGLADYSGLQDLLGSTERVKRIFKKYWDVYPPMEKAVVQFISVPCPANQQIFLSAYDDFLAGIRVNNTEFLRLCLDAYQKFL
jgi:hypothetical protein